VIPLGRADVDSHDYAYDRPTDADLDLVIMHDVGMFSRRRQLLLITQLQSVVN